MRKLNSLHNRLFLLFLTCMLGLILAFSALYYQKLTGIIHTQTQQVAEKNISQTVGLFDLLLKGYDSMTKSLNSNYEMLRLMKEMDQTPGAAVRVMNERTITNDLGAVYYSRNDIISIHVITNGGIIYSYERNFAGVVDTNYADKEWYRKIKQSSGEMVWQGLYQSSILNTMQQAPVFVFGRQLYDLTDHRQVGIIVFETDPEVILSALSNASLTPNSKAFILNHDNQIIAFTGKDASKSLIMENVEKDKAPKLDIKATSINQLVVSDQPKLADWTVMSFTPKSDMNARISRTRQYLFAVIAALIVLSTVLATIISRTISSPLKLLIREMRQVEMGNFHGSVNVQSFEEINSLVSSFNRMVHRMDELIDRITLASVSEKNAEIAALQAQVNPHFLYNTLDMIYWMLDERGNDKLGKVILALSQIFRYSSNWEEASKTTLRHELEQMKQYLTIIESRLDGRVSTVIEIEDEWLNTVIPKMTLQPIIENAVKAGLEPLNRPGIIRIYSAVQDYEFHLVIEDNGIGIEPDTLNRIRESLGEDIGQVQSTRIGSGRRGIGLQNVHRRLVLQFGEAYGLRINSTAGQGTTVIIAMPMTTRGTSHGTIDRG